MDKIYIETRIYKYLNKMELVITPIKTDYKAIIIEFKTGYFIFGAKRFRLNLLLLKQFII